MDTNITLPSRALDAMVELLVQNALVIDRAQLIEVVRALLRGGRKIEAVRVVKVVTGHSLLLSKTIVDIEEAKLKAEQTSNAVEYSRSYHRTDEQDGL